MAAILPTVVFPTMTSDAEGITIPYADLAGLTQAEANVTTGDGRKVLEALVRNAVQNILALDAVNRPAFLTVAQANAAPAAAPGRYSQTYTVTAIVSAEVGAEAELVAEV